MKSVFRGVVGRLLIVTMSSTVIPRAEGAVIGTNAAINADRERILMLIDRPDVAAQLEAYGVSPTDAKGRVAVLSDAEVARLSAEIDKANVGGGGGGGVVAAFIVALTSMMMVALIIVIAVPVVLVGGVIAIAGKNGKRGGSASTGDQP